MKLIQKFAEVAAARPAQIALLTERSQLTFEDLLGMAHLIDIELTTRGVRPGQTVVLDTSRAEFCIAFALYVSARGVRGVFATVPAIEVAELAYDRFVTLEPNPNIPEDRQIVLGPEMFGALGSLPLPDYRNLETTGASFVFQTSGSTGVPKLVERSEDAQFKHFERRRPFGEVDLSRRRLAVTFLPSSGYSFITNFTVLLAGGSVLGLSSISENLLSFVDLYHVDTLLTTPAVIAQFIHLPGAPQFLGSLRDVRIAGASVSPSLIADFERVCPAHIYLGYGAAEIGAVFSHIHERGTVYEEGYVGTPSNDYLDFGFFDEAGTRIDAEEGILGLRQRDTALVRRTADGPDVGAQNDGFYLTGDIFRRDGDRYYFLGRAKNTANFGGNKYSLELMAGLLSARNPGATLVPLIEIDGDGLETLVIVATGLSEGKTATELEEELSTPFLGARVSRLHRVESLPLTATGKVDAQALRARFVR